MVSLETRDYVEAVQRAREIMDAPELQPAQSSRVEVERFLKHKYETNRSSKMSADSKRSCLNLFADGVKNISPTNVTRYRCKAFYNTGKSAHRREHCGKLHVHAALILQLVREGKSMPSQSRSRCST